MIFLVLPYLTGGEMLVFGYQHHWPELRQIIWPIKNGQMGRS